MSVKRIYLTFYLSTSIRTFYGHRTTAHSVIWMYKLLILEGGAANALISNAHKSA